MRAVTRGLTFALATSIASFARADSQTNAAVAEALFRDAKALLAKGQTGPACRKLEESQRLDPGGGTLLSLALCHEKEGKTATAWSEFQASVALAHTSNRGDRERVASAHAASLLPTLSRLIVEVTPSADVAGLEVRVDDVAIGKAAWGSKLPIDPGGHKITASANGYEPWSTNVDVSGHADVRTISVPALTALPPPVVVKSEDRESSSGATRRNMGIAGVAAGAVAIAIGAAFGIRAFAKNSDSEAGCKNGSCNPAGFDDYQSGKTAATISDVGFGAGIALAAAGGYLLVTSRSRAKPKEGVQPSIHLSASVSPSRSALVLDGRF